MHATRDSESQFGKGPGPSGYLIFVFIAFAFGIFFCCVLLPGTGVLQLLEDIVSLGLRCATSFLLRVKVQRRLTYATLWRLYDVFEEPKKSFALTVTLLNLLDPKP